MEFYVFLDGNPLLNERKYGVDLRELGERLSPGAGLHVEFKIDSLEKLRSSPVSMFTYDLVAGHRTIVGGDTIFQGCEHHLQAEKIPLSEATRLLFNRCTGLLLAKELLAGQKLTPEQKRFHWPQSGQGPTCLGRCRAHRLRPISLELSGAPPALEPTWSFQIRCPIAGAGSAASTLLGVAFKLHPKQSAKSPTAFEKEHREISALALELWLWTESRRFKCKFSSVRDYAFNDREKCLGPSGWRNYLLNLKTFGPGAAFDAKAARYPRERLFNSLPLLLWNGEVSKEPEVTTHLQRQLGTAASDWQGLVAAYKQIWPAYG